MKRNSNHENWADIPTMKCKTPQKVFKLKTLKFCLICSYVDCAGLGVAKFTLKIKIKYLLILVINLTHKTSADKAISYLTYNYTYIFNLPL